MPNPETTNIDNMRLKYLSEIVKTSELTAKEVYEALRDGFTPIVLGGDHSIALH